MFVKAAVTCFILFSNDLVSFYCKKSIFREVPSSPFTSLFSSLFRVLVMSDVNTNNGISINIKATTTFDVRIIPLSRLLKAISARVHELLISAA